MNTITFDQQAKLFILNTFDKVVDEQGLIVEKSNPDQKVLTPDGEELEESNFAGIKRGSEIFIKSDLPSLINLYDSLE